MRRFIVAIFAICACPPALIANAQDQQKEPTRSTAPYSYVPELSDLMIITYLRYSNLSFAVERNNWNLANYEVAHLRKIFDVAAKLYPAFQDVQQAKLIEDISKPAVTEIENAIKDKDLPKFAKSYQTLTQACNSCHQQAKVGFIDIRQPYKAASGDQLFPPAPKVVPPLR